MLKTEFGTFDISTSEGRQQWLKAMNDFNAKIASPAHTAHQNSADSAAESAKIEFIIPKLTGARPTVAKGTENVESTVQTDSQVQQSEVSESTVSKSQVLEPIVPLTLEEIRAKLDESVQKNYRRVFIPGRGWVSLRKLQEEADAFGSPATA